MQYKNAGIKHNLFRKLAGMLVMILDNREEMLRECHVDAATGEIATAQTEIFTQDVLDSCKESQSAKKADKYACSSSRKEIEELILKDRGICSDLRLPDSLNVDASNTVEHRKFPINSSDVEAASAGILLSDEKNSSNLQEMKDDKVALPRSQKF